MKSQRIPEHKLNVTTTVGQALENVSSRETPGAEVLDKSGTKQVNQIKDR